MAPKRPASSASTPSPKKPRLDTRSQMKLDTFFKPPTSSPVPGPSKQSEVIVIDDELNEDAMLAAELARADGIDLQMALRLEADMSSTRVAKMSSTPVSPPTATSNTSRVLGFHASASHNIAWPDLSQDSLLFHPGAAPPWNTGRAPYSFLAHALATLSATRSRILIMNTLTNTLRSLMVHDSASVVSAMYLLSNALSPVYVPVELGIGGGIITKALQHVSGLSSAALRKLYHDSGDPGDVAFAAKSSVRTLVAHAALTISGVHHSLLKIARCVGQGSAKQKQAIVEQLIVSAHGEEVRYLVRTLGQNLRVGAVRTTLLSALARAAALSPPPPQCQSGDIEYYVDRAYLEEGIPLHPPKKTANVTAKEDGIRKHVKDRFASSEALVRQTFSQHPNYDDIVSAMLDWGFDQLSDRVQLSIGIPLHPTLGSPTRSLDEVYEKFGTADFTAELKLDGQRGQIHAQRTPSGIEVKIFSRHLEDMTEKYPDITALVEEMFAASSGLTSFILDSEIVAINKQTNEWRSFQELSNRARKDVKLEEVKIAVCVFAFDLMELDGEILIKQSLRRRRELLRNRLPRCTPVNEFAARFDHVASCDSSQGRNAIDSFWEQALLLKTEGFMCKLLDHTSFPDDATGNLESGKTRRKPMLASYEPDKRTFAWLKLKQDYIDGLGDSLDLVPIGAWHGMGRKAKWWSPILLAVMDSRKDKFIAVCKCMSGFTDEFYKSLNDRYPPDSDTCSRTSRWDVETGGLRPTVYFKPTEVWEIKGADITLSPVSIAAQGIVSQDRGLSLRFPRFIRLREDKSVQEASGPELLVKMWNSQERQPRGGADDYDLVDLDVVADEEVDFDDDEEEV